MVKNAVKGEGDSMAKKRKVMSLILSLPALLLLAGCSEKETESNLTSISTLRQSFDEETERLRDREFDNLDFHDAYFAFPEVDAVYNLEYENAVTDFTWSPEEAYDYLCKQTDELFPGLYDEEQKAYEIRFMDAEPVNREASDDIWSQINATDNYDYPTLEQYQEEDLVTTELPCPMITNRDCYLELYNGVLKGYDQGELARRTDYSGKLEKFDALEIFPIVYRTIDLHSLKTFHLESGDISIADAVQSADEYLSNLELSYRELPFQPKVQSVNVLAIGGGCYAFYFKVVEEYKGMEFHAAELDKTSIGITYLSDSTNEGGIGGVAAMCEAGQITRYRMSTPFLYSDVTETAEYDAIIPLEQAAELTSVYLTDGMEFKVLGATAVYVPISEKDSSQYMQEEEYQHRQITVRPCWRFFLQPTNTTGKLYDVFVDMITGKTYTFIQVMESDVEYE